MDRNDSSRRRSGIVDKWRTCLTSGEIFEYETRVRLAAPQSVVLSVCAEAVAAGPLCDKSDIG